MDPKSLIELIGRGSREALERQWTQAMETVESLGDLAEYAEVLVELGRASRATAAEELAWSGVETLASRFEPKEILATAGSFLRAVGQSDTLRSQIVELYQKAYEGTEGLDELIAEAGLGGGRPVRRALRTLDLCLSIKQDDYLVSRDEDGAARVSNIDRASWQIRFEGTEGEETLGAVLLADRFRLGVPNEFCVMRVFDVGALKKRIASNPVAIVTDLCREHGGVLESDTLESLLVPDFLNESEWKKWWTKARTAVRRSPNLELEGRSPYTVRYVEKPAELDAGVFEEFSRKLDPKDKLAIVEEYIHASKSRGLAISDDLVRSCLGQIEDQAVKLSEKSGWDAGVWWAVARRIANLAGVESASEPAIEYFRLQIDLRSMVERVESAPLVSCLVSLFLEVQWSDESDRLLELLPILSTTVCDKVVARLLDTGVESSRLESAMQRVLASPLNHFGALLWLWDGPAKEDALPVPSLATTFARILRGLDECRRSETLGRGKAKTVNTRARSVLAARKFERFDRMLEQLARGMASALRTQIRIQDGLGRAVREDLVRRLDRKFPSVTDQKGILPWELDDVMYVTAEALRRKQEEVEHHVNVTMKKNSEAIGAAAERGDLSENSEYKFALEERDLLRARLGQMNAEVTMARVLSPEHVPTDHVGIGTRVSFRRVGDGDPYEVGLVSPWEADPDKGWINYRAPLAAKILGRKVGDSVNFDHSAAKGEYEIVSLANLFAEAVCD